MMTFGRLQETVAAILEISMSLIKALSKVLCSRLNGSVAQITDLPIEVLADIISYVPVEDLPNVSKVSKTFYDATKIDCIWKQRSFQDYNAFASGDFLWRDIYTKLLYKYGNLIGYWQAENLYFGGLLEVKFEDGKIVGNFLFPMPGSDISRPLMKQRRFHIFLNSNNEAEVHCTINSKRHHKGKLNWFGRRKFCTRCEDVDSIVNCSPSQSTLPESNSINNEEFEEIYRNEIDRSNQNGDVYRMNFTMVFSHVRTRVYYQLPVPKKLDDVPIQPGFFTGTYGMHGVQLIQLDYENKCVVRGIKITGDSHVPARESTFCASLNSYMCLNPAVQSSIRTLEPLEISRLPYNPKTNKSQYFQVPSECTALHRDIPKVCLARFHASGQVAGPQFTNSSLTHGHWIVFNENLFGFLWLELLQLSMFQRVQLA